jgi:hypothetical protein
MSPTVDEDVSPAVEEDVVEEDVVDDIRFNAHPGLDYGICPGCRRHGEVGRHCLVCCKAIGMLVGLCPFCGDWGQVGDMCVECETRVYKEEVEWGTCPLCNGEGVVGSQCYDCEDQGQIHE